MIVDKHQIVKLALKDFREEINTLMKPHGFNFSVRLYKGGYWKDAKVRIDIKTPGWFDAGGHSWNRSDKANKLESSVINRIVKLVIDYDENNEEFKWHYPVDDIYKKLTGSEVEHKIEFNILFNGT